MKSTINSTLIGCFLGLIVPVLVVFLFYFFKYQANMSVDEFLNSLLVLKLFTHVMALGVYVGNLAFFFLFVKTDLLRAARGVLLATILYSLAIAIFRLGF